MRLNDKQLKEITRWINRHMRRYFDGESYDYTVAAEVCGNELFGHQGFYAHIVKETEYYAVNHT
jgi:hypothetical protein